jgi:hypothetical protein
VGGFDTWESAGTGPPFANPSASNSANASLQ